MICWEENDNGVCGAKSGFAGKDQIELKARVSSTIPRGSFSIKGSKHATIPIGKVRSYANDSA
jgi:hypothetical protein